MFNKFANGSKEENSSSSASEMQLVTESSRNDIGNEEDVDAEFKESSIRSMENDIDRQKIKKQLRNLRRKTGLNLTRSLSEVSDHYSLEISKSKYDLMEFR